MAIEDERYAAVVDAVNALIATGRTAFAKTMLIGLAFTILKHYGYEITEQTGETK